MSRAWILVVLAAALAAAPMARAADAIAAPLAWAYPRATPEVHSPLPQVAAQLGTSEPLACAGCHGPHGQGQAGSVNLAGLCAEYLVEQVKAFETGARTSTVSGMPMIEAMRGVSEHLSAFDLDQAAAYYSTLKFEPRFKLVETTRVPVTRASSEGGIEAVPGGGVEALGRRVIELASNSGRGEVSDLDAAFLAYAPPGSTKRGAALVHARAFACTTCHGKDLRGEGPVPPLAGRSPSYLARQLWDIRTGHRGGAMVAPMRAQVARLGAANIVDIAAYLASLPP